MKQFIQFIKERQRATYEFCCAYFSSDVILKAYNKGRVTFDGDFVEFVQ